MDHSQNEQNQNTEAASLQIKGGFSKNKWTLKIAVLGLMALLLLIPTGKIQSLIREREGYRIQASEEVQALWGGAQTLSTPLLTLPFRYDCSTEKQTQMCESEYHLYPDLAKLQGDFEASVRERGIYKVPLYQTQIAMDLKFNPTEWLKDLSHFHEILWERASISLYLADTRGISEPPRLSFGSKEMLLSNRSNGDIPRDNQLNARLDLKKDSLYTGVIEMRLDIELKGAESFHLLPYGKSVELKAHSNWSSPSFNGYFLPLDRTVTDSGFVATWKVMSINHRVPQVLFSNEVPPRDFALGFDQKLMVDHYKMAERSIKYVLLFIVLTFVLIFFAEALTGRVIHPVQYLLVGCSLLLFYSLLISLSEQMDFSLSYWVASLAVSVQIGIFLRALLKELKVTWMGIVFLNLLYGFNFSLLKLEEIALLVGSLGLFLILGALMYLSLKVPWNKENLKENGKPLNV